MEPVHAGRADEDLGDRDDTRSERRSRGPVQELFGTVVMGMPRREQAQQEPGALLALLGPAVRGRVERVRSSDGYPTRRRSDLHCGH